MMEIYNTEICEKVCCVIKSVRWHRILLHWSEVFDRYITQLHTFYTSIEPEPTPSDIMRIVCIHDERLSRLEKRMTKEGNENLLDIEKSDELNESEEAVKLKENQSWKTTGNSIWDDAPIETRWVIPK